MTSKQTTANMARGFDIVLGSPFDLMRATVRSGLLEHLLAVVRPNRS
jgi:hypothetical protein